MVTLACKDYAEAIAKARELWDKECEEAHCPVAADKRGPEWTQNHYPPFVHADTKVIAIIVPDSKLLSAADAAKAVTIAPVDEYKWQPAWDAEAI